MRKERLSPHYTQKSSFVIAKEQFCHDVFSTMYHRWNVNQLVIEDNSKSTFRNMQKLRK